MDSNRKPKKEVCSVRLKDYAQNAKRRKEYVQQPCLLIVAVDVSKAKHDARIGTKGGIVRPKLIGQGLLRSLGKFIKAISACSSVKSPIHWMRY